MSTASGALPIRRCDAMKEGGQEMPTLHFTCFWCQDIDDGGSRSQEIRVGCTTLAKKYGIDLDFLPASRTEGFR